MATDWDRRVIPRWRTSSLSSSLAETKPLTNVVKNFQISVDDIARIEKEVLEWKSNPDIGGAADLLNYVHIESLRDLLLEPAKYLLDNEDSLPQQLRNMASSLVTNEAPITLLPSLGRRFEHFRHLAQGLKKRLIIDPRNSIALVDLARIYAALGQNEQAKKAIQKALLINPDHRFILRSGVRFLVHNGEVEHALNVMNNSPRTIIDPWLMAAHISLETILGITPKYLKKANSLIDSDKFSPLHTSELSSSVATFRTMNGDIKVGKRHFNKALISPNDNVVAQALWAAQRFNLQINIQPEWLLNPFSHEARYYQHIHNADFELAIKEANEWFEDEPFASRPLRAATYICCVLGHYEEAERYARQGLCIDSGDLELKSNLIYALAAQNKLDDALSMLAEVVKSYRQVGYNDQGHCLANYGMINFRKGDYQTGEKFYKLAIEQFEKDKNYIVQANAAAYMARESLHSNNPNTSRLVKEAADIIKKYPSRVALKIMQMSNLIENPQPSQIQNRSAKWTHDSEKNILLIEKSMPFSVSKDK